MARDFNEWLDTMTDSINGYDYYVNFSKVVENVKRHKHEFALLGTLIGEKDIEKEFRKLVAEYPKVLQCIPILLAVRKDTVHAEDGEGSYDFDFKYGSNSMDEYVMFCRKTGLFSLIRHHLVRDMIDYATGVEVGLDSNGRKNRGGHQMEDTVEKYIMETGVVYHKEMYLPEVEEEYGLDLSCFSSDGTSNKRWDFVVQGADGIIYLMEVNFYGGSGSKLNETARSYELLALKAREAEGAKFVWVTDGIWRSARHNLEETFKVLPTLYNIADLRNGAFDRLFKKK
jgi:type II restriction enzyme